MLLVGWLLRLAQEYEEKLAGLFKEATICMIKVHIVTLPQLLNLILIQIKS